MLRFGGGYHARWGKHIKDVLAVMKQNKGLCSINMDTERTDYNEYAVCICKEMHHHFLYFNRFSRLRQEDELIRPSLVGLTLCQPQYTLPVELLYLLLDMHTDTLCDLLFEYLEKADHDWKWVNILSLGGFDDTVPLSAFECSEIIQALQWREKEVSQ